MAELRRGANAALTREMPGLTGLVLGIRWNTGAERALADSLVMATLLCDARGKVLSPDHFVFFNQLDAAAMSVQQRAAALGTDAEQVEIDFAAVPDDVQRIVAALYINEIAGKRRSIGQLRELVVRVLDLGSDQELVRSENLAPALSGETAAALCEVYRHGGGWKFRVVGAAYDTGITGLAKDYGVPL